MQGVVKKSSGAAGLAMVRKLKNNITVSFVDTHDVYEIDDVHQLDEYKNFENGEYNVVMSADGTKIFSLKPTQGNYIMDFIEVGNKTNDVPDSKIIKGGKLIHLETGGTYLTKDRMVWYVMLRTIIPNHRFDGLVVRHELPFIFVNNPGSKDMMYSGTKREMEKLESFFRASGIDLGELVIPQGPHTSVLSFLDRYLTENHKPIMVALNEAGFVDSVSSVPANLLPATKKTRKKS
jgi:hypothetical protein